MCENTVTKSNPSWSGEDTLIREMWCWRCCCSGTAGKECAPCHSRHQYAGRNPASPHSERLIFIVEMLKQDWLPTSNVLHSGPRGCTEVSISSPLTYISFKLTLQTRKGCSKDKKYEVIWKKWNPFFAYCAGSIPTHSTFKQKIVSMIWHDANKSCDLCVVITTVVFAFVSTHISLHCISSLNVFPFQRDILTWSR